MWMYMLRGVMIFLEPHLIMLCGFVFLDECLIEHSHNCGFNLFRMLSIVLFFTIYLCPKTTQQLFCIKLNFWWILLGSVAQLNRALDYGSRGFRFESWQGHWFSISCKIASAILDGSVGSKRRPQSHFWIIFRTVLTLLAITGKKLAKYSNSFVGSANRVVILFSKT